MGADYIIMIMTVILLTLLYCLVSDFLWMVHLSENIKTWNPLESLSQRSRQWEYTRASGTLKTGQRKAGGSRQTGTRLHLWLLTETSMQMLVFGPMANHHAVGLAQPLPGWTNSLITQTSKGCDGCRRTSWYTTTALIHKGSLRVFLRNAK